MSEKQLPLIRPQAAEQMSSPDHITDYLRVTRPHMWIILSVALLLLIGMIVWASIGVLDTKVPVTVLVSSGEARIVAPGGETLSRGMQLNVEEHGGNILYVTADEFGRPLAVAKLELPDGSYKGDVVTGSTNPISFLLDNW